MASRKKTLLLLARKAKVTPHVRIAFARHSTAWGCRGGSKNDTLLDADRILAFGSSDREHLVLRPKRRSNRQ